jgi:phospholipid/cholesterol/gamma-HCH transport system substrate-binding protein
VINNLSALSDSLSQLNISPVFEELKSSLAGINTIVHKLNSTESSAGLLMNDPVLYQNLSSLTASMDLLLNDVRNNPKRYVHFSAFKFGKDVYISPTSKASELEKEVVYKIHLISSPARLSTESTFFKDLGPIEEMKVDESFNYLAGNSSDVHQITQLLETARRNFPDANLVAFKNGKKIKLEKAIKNGTN